MLALFGWVVKNVTKESHLQFGLSQGYSWDCLNYRPTGNAKESCKLGHNISYFHHVTHKDPYHDQNNTISGIQAKVCVYILMILQLDE